MTTGLVVMIHIQFDYNDHGDYDGPRNDNDNPHGPSAGASRGLRGPRGAACTRGIASRGGLLISLASAASQDALGSHLFSTSHWLAPMDHVKGRRPSTLRMQGADIDSPEVDGVHIVRVRALDERHEERFEGKRKGPSNVTPLNGDGFMQRCPCQGARDGVEAHRLPRPSVVDPPRAFDDEALVVHQVPASVQVALVELHLVARRADGRHEAQCIRRERAMIL